MPESRAAFGSSIRIDGRTAVTLPAFARSLPPRTSSKTALEARCMVCAVDFTARPQPLDKPAIDLLTGRRIVNSSLTGDQIPASQSDYG